MANYGKDFQGYGAAKSVMGHKNTAGGGSFGAAPFSHKAPTLATDMRCYFKCKETFKKDFDLHLHLKIRHKGEDQNELRKAYQAAEEEIALTRRSCSTFQCQLCPKQFHESGAFYGHVRKNHNMQWKEYTDQYGRCEVESAPFECKICGRVVKYGRHTVHVHLRNVHSITWMQYLERIRRMRDGEAPEELPSIEVWECKVCNAQVKFIFRGKHLKGVHKITESEYVELFKDDLKNDLKHQANTQDSMGTLQDNQANQYLDSAPDDQYEQYSEPSPPYLRANGRQPRIQSYDSRPQFPDQPLLSHENLPERSTSKPPKSDIQDKTNRNCSVCAIAFDSRRNFIGHCTTVHHMKFRTASGATISGPIPTTNHRIQEVQRDVDVNGNNINPYNKEGSRNIYNQGRMAATYHSAPSIDEEEGDSGDNAMGHQDNTSKLSYTSENGQHFQRGSEGVEHDVNVALPLY